ncbi:hypothetical protein SAMN05216344_11475 [Polaromonas sp. OV174]|uniref:hypothetical protein n=1 Tax=Polaromonas sp. OV174 TaxID=1855300 RepID=UPI0008E053F3|nr:hypothetical protein [Polaromonas sp. OV174]SFC33646.1 hypothetical protein SAMN05216344_11475 [Polaromonas sp. OV174]
MNYEKTQPQALLEPEVVLNLWAYAGEDGYVMRLSAKAYVMQGDDKHKLSLLHDLSSTDFLSAAWQKVPENFKMNGPDGEEMKGVAHASMLSNEAVHGHLFGSLMEEMAENLPMQVRSLDGEYIQFKLDLPQNPLAVTTLVIEYEDGRLVPMVSNQEK